MSDRDAKNTSQSQRTPNAENPLINDLFSELASGSAGIEQNDSSAGTSSLPEPEDEALTPGGSDSRSPRSFLFAASAQPLDGSTGALNFAERPSLSFRQQSRMEGAGKVALEAVNVISQRFVHALTMNRLDFYFTSEELARREQVRTALHRMSEEAQDELVLTLIDLLEDVRAARRLAGPLSTADNAVDDIRELHRSNSLGSTVSTASLMRPPVHETHKVAMAYDTRGHRMINRYVIVANIGQGAYGKVKLAEEADTGRQVAIKIIDRRHLKKKIGGLGADTNNVLNREIAIMKKVRHRNCVVLHEVIDDPGSQKLYLIMDYVPNGSIVRLRMQHLLPSFLRSVEAGELIDSVLFSQYHLRCAVRRSPLDVSPLTEKEMNLYPTFCYCKPVHQDLCALYLRQLVSGLRYMHQRHVIHHDIKPDNILLGTDNRVYLTDFGVGEILEDIGGAEGAASHNSESDSDDGGGAPLTRHINRRRRKSNASGHSSNKSRKWRGGAGAARFGGGTLLFTAPEVFARSANPAVVDPFFTDIWALGVTLYCMLIGCAPFSGATYDEVAKATNTLDFPWNGTNVHSEPLSPQWKVILDGMLAKSPAQRWPLVRLKNYLDEHKVQLARRTSKEFPNCSGTREMNSLSVSAALESSQHQLSTSEMPSLLKFHQISAEESDGDESLPQSTGGINISEREIMEATRRERVEVVEVRPVISSAARRQVQSFVERFRQRVQRQRVPMFHSPDADIEQVPSPLSADSSSSDELEVAAGEKATAGSSPTALPRKSTNSSSPNKRRKWTITGSSPSSGLQHARESPSHRRANGSSREAGGDGESSPTSRTGCHANGRRRTTHSIRNLARVRSCTSESLDALLSIVNLRSESAVSNCPSSSSSSSSSSWWRLGQPPQLTSTTHSRGPARSPRKSKGQLCRRMSNTSALDALRRRTLRAPTEGRRSELPRHGSPKSSEETAADIQLRMCELQRNKARSHTSTRPLYENESVTVSSLMLQTAANDVSDEDALAATARPGKDSPTELLESNEMPGGSKKALPVLPMISATEERAANGKSYRWLNKRRP